MATAHVQEAVVLGEPDDAHQIGDWLIGLPRSVCRLETHQCQNVDDHRVHADRASATRAEDPQNQMIWAPSLT